MAYENLQRELKTADGADVQAAVSRVLHVSPEEFARIAQKFVDEFPGLDQGEQAVWDGGVDQRFSIDQISLMVAGFKLGCIALTQLGEGSSADIPPVAE